MRHGTRDDMGMAPPGAYGPNHESGGQGVDPGRSVDDIIAEIRQSLGSGQMAGGNGPEAHWASAAPLAYVAANTGGSSGSMDLGATGAALAAASFVFRPRVASWIADRLTAFYYWYMAHTKCRWCCNVTALSLALFLMLA